MKQIMTRDKVIELLEPMIERLCATGFASRPAVVEGKLSWWLSVENPDGTHISFVHTEDQVEYIVLRNIATETERLRGALKMLEGQP